MAVAGAFTIPQQPSEGGGADALVGTLRVIPLGGNGKTAPHLMYEVAASLASDASGGNNEITISFDTRFKSLVTLVNIVNTSASGAIEAVFELVATASNTRFRAFDNAVPVNSLDAINLSVWNPPPLMDMDQLVTKVPNVTGDVHIVNAMIYCFNRRVLEMTPIYQILANLPRPGLIDHPPN